MKKFFYEKIALSNKYKPIKWNELIGQEKISISLKNAIENNLLSQVILFLGPKGVGKNVCAHILANELNSFYDEKKDFSSNIFEINGVFNFSLKWIYKIINQSRLLPKNGKYNIFIINNLQNFNQEILNLFFHFIEEKNPHILFIFCVVEEKIVPEFILPYCQIFEFENISVKKIFFHLKMISEKENIKIENESLLILSQQAKGSLKKGINLFDKLISINGKEISKEFIINKLNIFNIKYYFEIVNHILNENISKILILLNKILHQKNNYSNFLFGLTKHFRDLFLSKNYETISILKFKKEIIQSYINQSKKIPLFFLIHALNVCHHLENEYRFYKENFRLTIEINLIQLSYFFSINKKQNNPNNKTRKIEEINQEKKFSTVQENEKIHFLKKNWIKFIQEFSENMNTEKISSIYLDFLKKETQFQIIKNEILIIIPCKLNDKIFFLIQKNFEKFFQKKLNNPNFGFKIIKKNIKESQIEKYNFLYQKNKLIETLIKRLDLKIPFSGHNNNDNYYN
ncbi:hypothetical protein [Blattabacterium cuenoti]|uniref:hypothetical protein n=1 Tax=Blattabacterium cuenoti TaxID=1653831 RepID=UPI00163CD413|nr:hypothetical protein [Blattabacterium cuenoti]